MSLADVTDPRFTADQLATLAAFEAAPTPPEVREAAVVERIIDALYSVKWPDGEPKLHMARTHVRDLAVAAYRATQDGGAEEAVLVDTCPLCDAMNGHWHGCGYGLSAPAAPAPKADR